MYRNLYHDVWETKEKRTAERMQDEDVYDKLNTDTIVHSTVHTEYGLVLLVVPRDGSGKADSSYLERV